MDMIDHLRQHHGITMDEDADPRRTDDLHHYHHTFHRPNHRLNENLTEPPDVAAVQRAKSDQWKPRSR